MKVKDRGRGDFFEEFLTNKIQHITNPLFSLVEIYQKIHKITHPSTCPLPFITSTLDEIGRGYSAPPHRLNFLASLCHISFLTSVNFPERVCVSLVTADLTKGGVDRASHTAATIFSAPWGRAVLPYTRKRVISDIDHTFKSTIKNALFCPY